MVNISLARCGNELGLYESVGYHAESFTTGKFFHWNVKHLRLSAICLGRIKWRLDGLTLGLIGPWMNESSGLGQLKNILVAS